MLVLSSALMARSFVSIHQACLGCLAFFGCLKGETSVVGTSSLVFHELCVARRVLMLDAGEATHLFLEHAVSGGYLVPHCN